MRAITGSAGGDERTYEGKESGEMGSAPGCRRTLLCATALDSTTSNNRSAMSASGRNLVAIVVSGMIAITRSLQAMLLAGTSAPSLIAFVPTPTLAQPSALRLSATENKILEFVRRTESEQIALLERAVNINSGTLNFAGVRAVA